MIRLLPGDLHGLYQKIQALNAEREAAQALNEYGISSCDIDQEMKTKIIENLNLSVIRDVKFSSGYLLLPPPLEYVCGHVDSDGNVYDVQFQFVPIDMGNEGKVMKKIGLDLQSKRKLIALSSGIIFLKENKRDVEAVFKNDSLGHHLYFGSNGASEKIITKQEAFNEDLLSASKLLTDIVNSICEKTPDLIYQITFK